MKASHRAGYSHAVHLGHEIVDRTSIQKKSAAAPWLRAFTLANKADATIEIISRSGFGKRKSR